MLILKIFRRPEWDAFRAAGVTQGAPIDLADGYIHFSTAAQVAETAAKWFATESDLVLVAFDPDKLGPELKWEPSRGGQLFPHLYRPLRIEEVVVRHEFLADRIMQDLRRLEDRDRQLQHR